MADPIYPASNNAEAIALNISNANQFFTVLQGGIDDFIPTFEGNGEIPSVAKALNEAAAYKVPIAWQTTGEATDLLQPYDFNGNIYVPLDIPAPFSTAPDNAFWRLYSQNTAQILIDNNTFTSDGVTTDFVLSSAVVDDPAAYFVSVDGVTQRPTIDYTVDVGTDTLSFIEAPPTTTPDNISVTILGALKGALSEGIYNTPAEGLANTPQDKFFNVVNSVDPDVFIDLYKNNGGSALLIDTYPNATALGDAATLKADLASSVTGEGAALVSLEDGRSVQVGFDDFSASSTGSGSDLVAHTGTTDTVTEALGKRTVFVGSVAELEAITAPTAGAHYDVTRYNPSYNVGGGVFFWDASRSKTEHNGGTIIDPDKAFPSDWTNATQVSGWFTAATSGNGCFVRKQGYIDTTAFGQVPGPFDANHTCINQAEATTTGPLKISDGQDFEVSGTVVLETSGRVYDWQGSVMSATSGNVTPLQISDTGYVFGAKFTNGEVKTSGTAGRTLSIPFGIAYCEFELSLDQQITNLEIIKETYNGVSGIYDSKFFAKQWAITNSHTVHAVDLTSVDTGRINGNTFSVERYDRSGTKQFFNIVCEAVSNWNYDNKWIDSTFEVTNGGNIRALGARGFACEDLRTWDLSVFNGGVTTSHLYDFDAAAGGLGSIGCRFVNCGRTDGSLGSGLYDINFGDCQDSTIDQCVGNSSIGVTHNVNNQRCVIVHGIGQTIANKQLSNAFFITANGLEGSLKDVAYSPATELTISSGEITVTQSRHTVDTEADAATDDLATISGGADGKIVKLRPASDARTVVLKNTGGNLRLSGAIDFSMDRLYDNITLMYDDALGFWVEQSRNEYP